VGYWLDNITLQTPECGSHEVSEADSSHVSLPTWTQECRKQNRKKRYRELESCSPLTRKIYIMQHELQKLLQERATLKRVRAPRRRLAQDYREDNLATESESSDSENASVVEAGRRVRYARKMGAERRGHNSDTKRTRITRSGKRTRN
jgi:hypothetical protein